MHWIGWANCAYALQNSKLESQILRLCANVMSRDALTQTQRAHDNGMHRCIHDASWSKFVFMLSYKAQSAGRKLIKVDPRNTTQRCSACGSIAEKDLSVRVHECPYCGFSCDRDYNASRNILITGMEQPVAPIELKPLHHISVVQVLAMKWEAAPFRTR